MIKKIFGCFSGIIILIICACMLCSTNYNELEEIIIQEPIESKEPYTIEYINEVHNVETLSMVHKITEKYIITAYCHCVKCCGKSNGVTASGAIATEGITVAADTRIFPFGTRIYIEGVGERIVQDTGGAIKGNRIDLYFSDHQSALNFGKQIRGVCIIE